ncbi:MAG: hypothetical protein ACRBF0_23590 [Calditrichia bacterium]
MSDLRNDYLKSEGILPGDEDKGRALLAAAALTHGLDVWVMKKTLTVVMRDEWQGLMTKIAGRPWNKEDLLRMTFRNGTFTSQATFLEGDRKNKTIGIQSWKTYERENDQQEYVFKDDDNTLFILPAFQYFFEMPFRLHTAELVAWMGEGILSGQVCDKVFITWNTAEPHVENDQYIVWINRETERIELVQYTVRDIFRFVTGEMRFQDYRELEGVLYPYLMTVSNLDSEYKVGDGYLHQIRVESMEFDVVLSEELTVNADIEELGDNKPGKE